MDTVFVNLPIDISKAVRAECKKTDCLNCVHSVPGYHDLLDGGYRFSYCLKRNIPLMVDYDESINFAETMNSYGINMDRVCRLFKER